VATAGNPGCACAVWAQVRRAVAETESTFHHTQALITASVGREFAARIAWIDFLTSWRVPSKVCWCLALEQGCRALMLVAGWPMPGARDHRSNAPTAILLSVDRAHWDLSKLLSGSLAAKQSLVATSRIGRRSNCCTRFRARRYLYQNWRRAPRARGIRLRRYWRERHPAIDSRSTFWLGMTGLRRN